MKIALDVDGVITEMPELFSVITAALKEAGHYVYILTDFDEHFRQFREKELAGYGIIYDELVIVSDKEGFCKENGVDFAIDDDVDYFPLSKRRLQLYAVAIHTE